MMRFLTLLFTWWNGETAGTRLTLWRDGEFVGEDAFGNRYYRSRGGRIDPALGHERRWVIYKDIAEASKIPPGWHGWMHHRVATPPSAEAYQPREWQAPHEQNHTGTARAYRPPGSTLGAGARPAATGDYESWTPGH